MLGVALLDGVNVLDEGRDYPGPEEVRQRREDGEHSPLEARPGEDAHVRARQDGDADFEPEPIPRLFRRGIYESRERGALFSGYQLTYPLSISFF